MDVGVGRTGVAHGLRCNVHRACVRTRRSATSLNRSLVGKTYDAATFVVDAERVERFARAVDHPREGVPPTFVTAPEIQAGLANAIADADLGVELARVLHGEQTYEWTRPLERGETVTATSTILDIRGRPSLEFLTIRTEIRAVDGTLVCFATTTLIQRRPA